MAHAAVVRIKNQWRAVQFESAAEAVAYGKRFGLRAALRTHGNHVSDGFSGDVFTAEVVDEARANELRSE